MEIGSEVKCIDASISSENLFATIELYPEWVKDQATYTVRGFVDNDGIVVGVLLEELHNPPVYQKLLGRAQEPAFATWRFVETLPPQEASSEVSESVSKEELV